MHVIDKLNYNVFHGFGQAKFASGGLILGSSQFSQLPQLPVKDDPKIIISLHKSKSVKHALSMFYK
jgi:hypothetical protein